MCWLLPGRFGDGERLLKRVLEKSPDRDTRGMACYGLANHLMTRAGYATQLQDPDQRAQYDEWLGEETSARLAEGNAVDLRKRSEMYFQRVVVEFGDVKGRGRTLGADAQRNLFELRNLQVGMVAPEIKGEDIDGTSFQISDYRGKVVVLDFWGNW